MGVSYLKSIRAAKLRCQSFQNPYWPMVDEDGQPSVGADGEPFCTYYVRVLSLDETVKIRADMEAVPDAENWWVIVSRTLCDENGETYLTAEDRATLAAKDPKSIELVVKEAMKVNGFGDAAKNS